MSATPLSTSELSNIHAYWRACNYLAAGMIYLQDNPLLERDDPMENSYSSAPDELSPAPQQSTDSDQAERGEMGWRACR